MFLISIIIPVYKVEKYIEQCLNSVICQTWNKDEGEIECILVDDCTPDNSMIMAKEILKKYQGNIHFIFLQHEINRGLSAARNTGLTKAKGEYIFFLDSDDSIAPNSLQIFINTLKQYPNVDLIMGQVIKKPSNDLLSKTLNQTQIFNSQEDIFYHLFNADFQISAWNKLTKRNILEKHQIKFIEGILFEDAPWMYRLFLSIDSAIFIPDATYYYTFNPSGIMASATSEKNICKAIDSYIIILNYLLSNPPSNNIFHGNQTIEYLLYIHLLMTRAMYLVVSKNKNTKRSQEFCKERKLLIQKALKSGRIPIIFFCLLFVNPLNKIMNFGLFRRNYFYMQKAIRTLSHLTDPLH